MTNKEFFAHIPMTRGSDLDSTAYLARRDVSLYVLTHHQQMFQPPILSKKKMFQLVDDDEKQGVMHERCRVFVTRTRVDNIDLHEVGKSNLYQCTLLDFGDTLIDHKFPDRDMLANLLHSWSL